MSCRLGLVIMLLFIMKRFCITLIVAFTLTSCATVLNTSKIPIELTFSDGSQGTCTLTNKRGSWTSKVPATVMVRRSDDALRYDCKSNNGGKSSGTIESDIEYGKFGISIAFIDFGITDAITDKHRSYQDRFVVPIKY